MLPCPRGCEDVLAEEVRTLGLQVSEARPTTVEAFGSLREGYRLCLWSRVASRVLLPLADFEASDDDQLYRAAREIPWWEHFDPSSTFAIGSSQAPKSPIPSHFWIQRAKDAIVDGFRARTGVRPSVDKASPSIRLHLHIGESRHELALDFSGGGQHRRGYRQAGGQAPLKENLAAAILYLADWPAAANRGLALVDPTCGSGTFLVEAAWMATSCAPGLLRDHFGFDSWLKHRPEIWRQELESARERRRSECPAPIFGYDASEEALGYARQNLRAAGVERHVALEAKPLSQARKPAEHGIVVCNPPYGHRLGDAGTLFLFYQALGDALKQGFGGWTAYVFAARNASLKHLGLRPARRHVLYNGAIECRLLEIPLHASAAGPSASPSWRKPSAKSDMFVNRIAKNRKKWERWARRHDIDAYRLYDGDIPEYDLAVDRYSNKVVVHFFGPRKDSDADRAQQRMQDVVLTLPDVLDVDPDDIVVKVRHRHDQGEQYARLSQTESEMVVREGGLRFLINLEDRIDTGLFLDHRKVRAHALERCEGLRALNLFAYTCTVSVAAAVAGARTTNVDLSNTYLEWGKRNFRLNGLDLGPHRFFRRDAMGWIAKDRATYDWIFINPPTFSRSKTAKHPFNVHKDHPALIEHAMHRLAKDGELLFTTHAQGFEIDSRLARRFRVEDVTRQFLPPDFRRPPFRAFRLSEGESISPRAGTREARSRARTSAKRSP